MTKKICLDANIIVKLVTHEVDSDLAEDLYSTENSSFFSPFFAKYEVFSVLRKKIWKHEVKSELIINEAIAYFKQLKIDYVTEQNSDLEEAYNLAEKLNLPVIYDCLYLVLAKKLNIPFVTEDQKFLSIAKKVYKKSFSLKEVVGEN